MLDGDHARLVAASLPVCAKYGLALAGGYAIKAHRLVDRPSEDIDFATAAVASMDEIISALASSYREAGCDVQVLDVDLRKGHLLVSLAEGGTYRVDVLKEPLNHPLTMTEFGPVIALRDAVALDQLDYAAMYPDEAFSRYGCDPSLISDMRTWAQEWSTQIGLELAAAEPWSDDGDWSDDG